MAWLRRFDLEVVVRAGRWPPGVVAAGVLAVLVVAAGIPAAVVTADLPAGVTRYWWKVLRTNP